MRYELVEVERFPRQFEAGVLYWSQEFQMCAHLCACGCGDVINLPVDAQNYRIRRGTAGPSLRPSVGNWGVCDAHYFITDGAVEWASKWSPERIAAARASEDGRREAHYAKRRSFLARLRTFVDDFWKWLRP